jgi:hypothetical protein
MARRIMTAASDLEDWLDRRAVLNHDVLANQVATELAMLAQQTDANPVRLMQWLRREPEYAALLRDAADVLDPAHLVDLPQFDVWTDERRSAMRMMVSERFQRTSAVSETLQSLEALLRRCVVSATAFLAMPPKSRTASTVAEMQSNFEQLSEGISSLPTRCGGTIQGSAP